MLSFIFDNMILGTISNGQGSLIAVDGTHRTTLRTTVESFVRGLSLRYDAWRALVLKRAAACFVNLVDIFDANEFLCLCRSAVYGNDACG